VSVYQKSLHGHIIFGCQSRRLQLNTSKVEVFWFETQSKLAKLNNSNCSLQIGASNIQPSTAVRNSGLHLDNQLSMKQYVVEVAATCRYLRQIRRRVGRVVMIRLVLALVTSTIDYCNSALAGLPQSTIVPLRRVQNAAARLVFDDLKFG